MRIRPEVRSAHAQPEVHEAQQCARDDVARRIRENDRLPRFRRGRSQQPLIVRVATDDAVEDDDVRGLRAVLGEVADVPLEAIGNSGLSRQVGATRS